jgi:hypothetical protein
MENWLGLQYYFNERLLTNSIMRAGFRILWQEKFEGFQGPESSLRCYFLGKQPSIKRLFKNYKNSLLHRFPIFQHYDKPDSLLKTQPIEIFNPQQIASWHMHNIVPDQHRDGRKFSFTATNEDPQIILTGFSLPGENYLLKIDMESPVETYLQIFYLQNNQDDFTENCSVRKKILPGPNLVRAFIPDSRAEGNLRLDPGNAVGKYIINTIEIATIQDNFRF